VTFETARSPTTRDDERRLPFRARMADVLEDAAPLAARTRETIVF
jgi:hypothetical protein